MKPFGKLLRFSEATSRMGATGAPLTADRRLKMRARRSRNALSAAAISCILMNENDSLFCLTQAQHLRESLGLFIRWKIKVAIMLAKVTDQHGCCSRRYRQRHSQDVQNYILSQCLFLSASPLLRQILSKKILASFLFPSRG